MILEDINVVVAGNAQTPTLQSAITMAVGPPNKAVIIPATYNGTDTYTNANNVPVIDLRPTATSTGITTNRITTGGFPVSTQATASAAAPITAAVGGTFVTTLNLPGYSTFEGVPFTVKASGWVTMPAGTYTATIQPNLLYCSTSLGFTASAAAAIVSVAAVTQTITSATLALTSTWETEATISGNTTTGVILGRSGGMATDVNGVRTVITPISIISANTPGSVAFTSTTAPLQFLTGVVLGSGAPATSVVTLGKFFIST